MWLINSRCHVQLRPYNPIQHTQVLSQRKTHSLLHYDLQQWTLQRDSEKRSTREMGGEGVNKSSIVKESQEGLLWTHQKCKKVPPLLLPLAPPLCKCSSPLLSCSLAHSPPTPLISPACDLLAHDVQKNVYGREMSAELRSVCVCTCWKVYIRECYFYTSPYETALSRGTTLVSGVVSILWPHFNAT